MAKRKNAIALFEVITAAKRKEREAEIRQSLGTPKWWFKGKGAKGDSGGESSSSSLPSAADVDPTSPAYVAASFASPYAPAGQPAAAPTPVTPAQSVPAIEPASAPVVAAAVRAEAAAPAGPRRPWFRMGGIKKLRLDPDRQEVTVRFRYTTAVIASFAIVVALGLAFVTGRRSSVAAGPNSPSTKDVQSGPILAGVLDPADGQVATLDIPADEPEPRAAAAGASPARAAGSAVPMPAVADRWTAPDIETRLPRVIGQNYVIVQSYLSREDADAARDALVAAGIPCTVERVPRSWSQNRNLFSVIGTHGFARPKSMPQYKSYAKAIESVGKAFAGKSKYKEFQPTAYQWKKEDADAARRG
jgi:hypothetical protein